MNWKRGFGIGLIFVGVFIILTGEVITGAVIGSGSENYLSLFGMLVLIIGFIFLLASKVGGLESEVSVENYKPVVFDSTKGYGGVEEDQRFYLKDPEHFFTLDDNISFGDFKEGYEIIKDDEELLNRAREVLGVRLLEILKEGYSEDREIAYKFLNILYEGKIPAVQSDYVDENRGRESLVSKTEKEEIKRAFRSGWKGEPNSTQKKVLDKYGFEHLKGDHGEIHHRDNNDIKKQTSSTPSDVNSGKSIGRDVIKMLEEYRRDDRRSNAA